MIASPVQVQAFLLFQTTAPDTCDFIVDPTQRRIDVAPEPALPDSPLEHLLIDQILPRCLVLRAIYLLEPTQPGGDGLAIQAIAHAEALAA